MAKEIKITETIIANKGDTCPEAIALFFFIGCNLSLEASTKSFKKYAPEEIAQKAIKALKDQEKTSPSRSVPAKKGAANTLRFFNHCRGLAVLAILYIFLIIMLIIGLLNLFLKSQFHTRTLDEFSLTPHQPLLQAFF